MPVVRISLLGVRNFTCDEQPWRFVAPPRTIPLLGYLLAAAGPTPREVLAAALWPDADEEEARGNLRRHLHHLSKAMPPSDLPWVRTDGDTVEWIGEARADVTEFRNALSSGDRRAAVDCYGGDFLEGFYDDWIISQRERFAADYVCALSDLLAESRSARDHAAALSYAQRILRVDEWREDVVRAVMSVRYEAGDRAGALGAFERFARRLAEEMHVDPMPETIALRDAIVRNASVSVSARETPLRIASSSSAFPFVGRTEELKRLRSLWEGVAHNSAAVAFVSGEAGIGKTRLVHEFALHVERQGGRVLLGGTSHPEAVPYEALAEALRGAVPYLSESSLGSLWKGVLAGIVPELLAHVPDPTAPERIGEHQERARLFEAIARALSALARTRPFLMVLEDLHWAGSATVQALEFAARRLAGVPAIILATYRTDELPHCSDLERVRLSLEREHRAIHVVPSRLRVEHVASMLQGMPQFADAPASLPQDLHHVSEGNPLFAVHLLREFAETGTLRRQTTASDALGATILSRVDRLSTAAQVLAEHAAVAGRTFTVDLLREATGWSEDDLLGAISELMDRHLVRVSFDRARYEYAFTHNLVQARIYDRIPQRERQRAHDRVARIFERMEAARPPLAGETALHWDRAGETERAAHAYLRAADAARSLYDNETARRYARRLLELDVEDELRRRALVRLVKTDERMGDKEAWRADAEALLELTRSASGEERFEALACAIRRFDSIGDRVAQRETLDVMKRLAENSGDAEQMAAALLEEGTMLWRQGIAAAGVEPLTLALARSNDAGNAELHLQALAMLVKCLIASGRTETARAELARAQSELRDDTPLHHRLALLRAAAGVAMTREDSVELARIAGEQRELARQTGDVEGEADAYRLLGYAAAYDELDLEAMQTHWSTAAQMFERAGALQEYAIVLTDLAGIEVELGRYEQAEELLSTILPLAERIGWRIGTAVALLNRAEVLCARGDIRVARDVALRALEVADATDYVKARCTARVVLGSVECRLGQFDAGMRHLRDGVALRRTSEASWSLAADLCQLIDGLLLAGQTGAAAQAAAELEQIYKAEPKRQMAPAQICWTLARVRRALGDEVAYRGFVRRGCEVLERRRARFKNEEIRRAFMSRPLCRELQGAEATTQSATSSS